MRIDAHQHFWSLRRGDYGWLRPELRGLYQDYGPEDIVPFLKRCGIDLTILVQAAPTLPETLFLLDLAEKNNFVSGVVGWVDFTARDAESTIARLASNGLLLGLRPMVQDIPDDDWLISPLLDRAFGAIIEQSLIFDALVLPRHLARLAILADRYPLLRIVVDHGAKPSIRERDFDLWGADITAIAARSNTYCKISGLVTEAAPDWCVSDLKPYVDHLLSVFGPQRLIWGSDWPVVNAAGGYEKWYFASTELFGKLSRTEQEAIFGGNASKIYLSNKVAREYSIAEREKLRNNDR